MKEGLVWILLGIFAWQDLRERQLPLVWLGAALAAGVGYRLAGGWEQVLALPGCLLPGAGVLGLSRITRGAIGSGDGGVLLAAGCFLGGREAFQLFWGGLVLASLGAAVCFLRGNARGKRLPFVPFLWAAWSLGMLARLAGL